MKTSVLLIAFFVVSILSPASTAANSINGANNYSSPVQDTPSGFPDWVERGEYCYTIAVFVLPDGTTLGRPLHARIVVVAEDQVRLRAMENISLGDREGCEAMGVTYGETWWGSDPEEVFRSKEEAENYLKEKGWLID